ncbi:MAG: 2,3-bisphosphoglycerate-independent phosphoglycerate mutase [Xanthomonadales bacterium]|nr:2,3-bisphosphoglycerate-independent phosphoglycerate mutase [Gammaproteobacteria bacterium]MBT8054993.1 2,3-bisphosphoglycerate-independent phosphoglycerate mutase [Gammaproteobacteria bacterium]NND56375.1 2,3-bisphosphoglycerate-independent phosphoglycerate mutase [Xanthomonadales bacterium]NNK50432.1 2,3-bisphosphoglycerate-independent phosphoglycerate mutase [Xanthomonadales bacterium]
MNDRKPHGPLLLMILDGWGFREETENNAIALAETPCWDDLRRNDPHTLIETSGEAVGLPHGQMGNSEVGHMNIGAGRIVYQDFSRITKAIQDGSFADNAQLCAAIDAATDNGGTLHIMGLLSPGGVHSHDDHFIATVELAAKRGAPSIAVHGFLDGRDTPPRSAEPSILRMQELLDGIPGANFNSISGRYYAMDRDKRWNRVERAYRAIALAESDLNQPSAIAALHAAYGRDENDEFVQPTVIGSASGVKDGDSIIFVNFRADRAREITMAFVNEPFDGFERRKIELSDFVCMTEYMAGLPVSVAFPPTTLPRLLGGELADAGLKQLRIAETEKYAHVTFFFNGGNETPYPHEHRTLIPSPDVATYDLQPEMSVPELTEKLVQAIKSRDYDVIICNVANPDMVGHTGKLDAAIKAVMAVDRCLASVREAIDEVGGEMLITADHGNIELMVDPVSGQSHTAHTTHMVPLLFHGRSGQLRSGGSLRDIAPTMLSLLGLPKPAEMSGQSLLEVEGGSA